MTTNALIDIVAAGLFKSWRSQPSLLWANVPEIDKEFWRKGARGACEAMAMASYVVLPRADLAAIEASTVTPKLPGT